MPKIQNRLLYVTGLVVKLNAGNMLITKEKFILLLPHFVITIYSTVIEGYIS